MSARDQCVCLLKAGAWLLKDLAFSVSQGYSVVPGASSWGVCVCVCPPKFNNLILRAHSISSTLFPVSTLVTKFQPYSFHLVP